MSAEPDFDFQLRCAILDELAHVLYKRMRHLEPNSTERKPWEELTEDERDFYECCAETLANEREMINRFWQASGLRELYHFRSRYLSGRDSRKR